MGTNWTILVTHSGLELAKPSLCLWCRFDGYPFDGYPSYTIPFLRKIYKYMKNDLENHHMIRDPIGDAFIIALIRYKDSDDNNYCIVEGFVQDSEAHHATVDMDTKMIEWIDYHDEKTIKFYSLDPSIEELAIESL
jgi:hypothetical protein